MRRHLVLVALAGCAASMSVPSQYAGKTTVRVRVHGSMQYEHRASLCEFRMVAEDDRDSKENWLSGKVAPTEQIDFKVKPQIYKAYFRACDDDWKASVTFDASESTEIVVMNKLDGKAPKWTHDYAPPGFEASAFAWVKVLPRPERDSAPTYTESGGGETTESGGGETTEEASAPSEPSGPGCYADGEVNPNDTSKMCCSNSKRPMPCQPGAFCGWICCTPATPDPGDCRY
jgi:hypothetical protein